MKFVKIFKRVLIPGEQMIFHQHVYSAASNHHSSHIICIMIEVLGAELKCSLQCFWHKSMPHCSSSPLGHDSLSSAYNSEYCPKSTRIIACISAACWELGSSRAKNVRILTDERRWQSCQTSSTLTTTINRARWARRQLLFGLICIISRQHCNNSTVVRRTACA